MGRRKPTTLTARLAWVQTGVTIAALAIVAIGASAAVSASLTRKTDQQLDSVLAGVAPYLEGDPSGIDWKWVEGEIQELRPADTRVEVRDAAGRLRVGVGEGPAELAGMGVGCGVRASARVCGRRQGDYLVLAGRNRSDDLAARDQLVLALAVASVIAGLIVAVASRAVTRRAIRPLSDLAARVRALEPGSGQRVAVPTDLTEVDLLARRFDSLVARFEEALAREKRFTAEASHELRTPLTIARAEIEALARGEGNGGGIARALAALERLASLVDALLWFARAQSRLDHERMELVNLADLVRGEVEELRRAHRHRAFACDLPDEALVRGDEHLIRRAVANLLDNAIKYGDEAPIEARLAGSGDAVVLSVANGGMAIPLAVREQIFVPFFRARNDGGQGFGLGLPFARAVARAHGGDVELGPAQAEGTEVLLRLPLVAWNELPPR